VTLVEILTEVRNRLLDSGDWGIGWSATADATAVMDAIDRIAQLEAENERLARISLAARALLKYIDDHDWGHIPEGVTADTLRDLLTSSETKGEQGEG
jgi:hypothetical protein